MFCYPPQPTWDITIHLHSRPASSLALFLSSNRCGTATKSTPLRGPTSLLAHRFVSTFLRWTARKLAHRPVSGSDTICNGPDPPLANIVLFGLSLSGFPSRHENASAREKFLHPYKWWFVLVPNQRGTSPPHPQWMGVDCDVPHWLRRRSNHHL